MVAIADDRSNSRGGGINKSCQQLTQITSYRDNVSDERLLTDDYYGHHHSLVEFPVDCEARVRSPARIVFQWMLQFGTN
jgi:hypothetical protein